MRYFPHPHTGIAIKAKIEEVYKEFSLSEEDVLRYFTDRGSNIIAALKSAQVQQPAFVDVGEKQEAEGLVEFELEDSDFDDIEIDNEEEEASELELFIEYSQHQEERLQSFPKRNDCAPHTLALMCHVVLDKKGTLVHQLKCQVLPLIKQFSSSGVASQKLKALTGKKLLKISRTRWNYFTYILIRLKSSKEAVCAVAYEQDFLIPFKWDSVCNCISFLEPIATATTFL